MEVFTWILVALGGYLIGSANFAIILTKCILHKDVREHGSCNAGTANVARVFGPWMGLATLAGDVAKTAGAMLLGRALLGVDGMCLAAAASVVGHCFPVFFGFRGGKGVASAAGIALMLDWRILLVFLGVYLLCAALTRTASIASLAANAALPVAVLLWGRFSLSEILLAVFAALVVWVMHRQNIARLFHGQEGRFHFGKRKGEKLE